jgi:hypothetical protein
MFAGPNAVFLSWNAAPVLAGSFIAQAGLVALLWHRPFLASALLGMSTAILTALSIARGAYQPGKQLPLPHSGLSVLMTFLLAAALTFGGVSAGGGRGFGLHPAPGMGETNAGEASQPSTAVDGDFPGVILLPPLKAHATLLVPVPSLPVNFGAPLVKPLGIPFSGEYWMFRWPARKPPRGATVRRGNPMELSFHTPDGWPMEMEAHQRLDPPVAAICCSAVQLTVQSSDPDPQAVLLLELVLMDTSALNSSMSLGTPTLEPSPRTEPVLRFHVPQAAGLVRFDEIKLVFHRARWRADKSAKMAIERFVLLP